jgi:hypothetical protein
MGEDEMLAGRRESGLDRRHVLLGIGAVGGALVASSIAPQPARAVGTVGLPVLQPTDNWATVLASTPQVQLVPGALYTLTASVSLPSNCLIVGNGAEVTVASDTVTAFVISGKTNVTVTGVRLTGRAADPINTAASFGHVGIRITQSFDVRVQGCDFRNWRGAGIALSGSAADNYYAYHNKIEGCTFTKCYLGVSIADRSEYSILTGNHFSYCRLAIWNSSGNWSITSNVTVGCYGAYYSIAATSPYGALASDNWSHGSVVGNTFNHSSNGGGTRWTSNTAFTIGGVSEDPGSGVVVRGLLPPTFTGNTLWYSNVTGTALAGTRWLLSGCTFSNLTISCTGSVPINLVGTQSNSGANAPVLSGSVTNLLP